MSIQYGKITTDIADLLTLIQLQLIELDAYEVSYLDSTKLQQS